MILILVLLSLSSSAVGQCDVKINKRGDGVTVNYTKAEMVGNGSECELGISISTNGTDYFLNTTILYYGNSKKTIGTLMIELSTNESLELEQYTSSLSTVNNYKVTASIYYLKGNDISKFKLSTIKKITFQEEGGLYQIINVKQNFDVIKRHINCLE